MEEEKPPQDSVNKVIPNIQDDDIQTVEKLTTKIDSIDYPDNFVETKNNSVKQEKKASERTQVSSK
ncbi:MULTISPECIES: hypothetical protein [Okeania]|uniref:hypothetical protein n=1 Tax=Okeania TaxID=1458928 RepID=UPI0019619D4E|nr:MULTISPECIES: hypothetical protein [Okeania]